MNKKVRMLIENKDIQRQFVRYILVGGSTAFFELTLFTFFRKAVHVDLALSNVIAVVLATLFNFILNRGWSFKKTSNLVRSMVLYIILFCLNMAFSTNAITLMVGWKIPDILAKLITMCMIMMWNFTLYRKIVFK
jgi:Predicted membrane protein